MAAVGWGLYLGGGQLIRLQQSTPIREKFVNRGCAHGNRRGEAGFGEHWRGDSGGRRGIEFPRYLPGDRMCRRGAGVEMLCCL